MAAEDLEQPAWSRRVPKRVLHVHFGLVADGAATVALQIEVSDKQNIKMYGFAYAGSPVVMSQGQGTFFATIGVKGLLEWAMAGKAGGTMKVQVLRDGDVIKERAKSTIPDADPASDDSFDVRGYDAFEIELSE